MAELNHLIIHCSDKMRSSAFLTGILGLPPAERHPVFMIVRLANGVSLDFDQVEGDIVPQHYAFLVGDEEFDAGLARVRALGLAYWADPGRTRQGEIAHRGGARGFYFEDPDGHFLELMTRMHEGKEDI